MAAVSGPRFPWQAVPKDQFVAAADARLAELKKSPQSAAGNLGIENASEGEGPFTELAAAESKLLWARGRGMVNTVFTGIEAACYVCYSVCEATFVLRRDDVSTDCLTRWSMQDRVNSVGTKPSVVVSAATSVATSAIELYETRGGLSAIFLTAEDTDEIGPQILQMADACCPGVVVLSTSSPSSVREVDTLRSFECSILWAKDAQEVHDLVVAAAAASLASLSPVVVMFDGRHTGLGLSSVQIGTPAWLNRQIGVSNSDDTTSVISSTISDAPLSTTSNKTNSSDSGTSIFDALTKVAYESVEYFGCSAPKICVLLFGPGGSVISELLTQCQDESIGLLTLRTLRPLNYNALVNKIPRSTETVVVLNWSGTKGVFQDIAVFVSEGKLKITLKSIDIELDHDGFTPTVATSLLTKVQQIMSGSESTGLLSMKAAGVGDTVRAHAGVLWSTAPAAVVVNNGRNLVLHAGSGATRNHAVRVWSGCDMVQGSKCSRTDFIVHDTTESIAAEASVGCAEYVAIADPAVLLIPQYDVLSVHDDALLVINCRWTFPQLDAYLPEEVKRTIAEKRIRVYTLDANRAADSSGCAVDVLLTALFWPLSLGQEVEIPDAIQHALSVDIVALAKRASASSMNIPTEQWLQCPPPELKMNRIFGPIRLGKKVTLDAGAVHQYTAMLEELFGDSVVVADSRDSASLFGTRYSPSADQSSSNVKSLFQDGSEFLLGVHLARLQKRRQLVSRVETALQTPAPIGCDALYASLQQWLDHHNDATGSRKHGSTASQLMAQCSHALPRHLQQIYEDRGLFAKPSKWILGGGSWSTDIGFSGIHHIIASGEDVNILVFDTTKQSDLPRLLRETGKTRKDIGLYAMNYGDTYVASTAALHSRTQALKALLEADAFSGPSVVLAYTPAMPLESVSNEVNRAVTDGNWPLYRWNPTSGDALSSFQLDSSKLRADLDAFIKRDTDMSLLSSGAMASSAETRASLESRMLDRQRELLESEGSDSVSTQTKIDLSITIAFGSDGGNALGLAEKIARKAEVRRVREVRCVEANALNIENLSEVDAVLFVMATAGQGEFCGNSKSFWKAFSAAASKGTASARPPKFAVLGLGDSAYWGKGTADSAKYFCKPAIDLDAALETLGSERLVDVGLGDDQHENGYEAAFTSWQDAIFDQLGVPAVEGEDVGGPHTLGPDDDIKTESNYLRGNILQSLADESTGKILPEDTKLTKFHGIYQQDNRDIRAELEAAGKERAYSFMIRVGIPGGVCTPEQYLRMSALANSHANGNLKLTTRQAFQLHSVIKRKLKPTIQEINKGLMDTLAACGDVCRNVIATPLPMQAGVHAEVLEFARKLSAHLKPQTSAYHEIWMDKKMVAGHASAEVEPLYGPTYLPRKFKVAIAIPPLNDVDVFSHCLGYIAIVVNGQLLGFNVTAGGGMGMTHGNTKTYPRLSDVLGFVTVDEAIEVGEKIMLVQRDHGDRSNRKHARLKYTIEDMGVDAYRAEVERRSGIQFRPQRPFKFTQNGDRFGWNQCDNGKFAFGIFVEHGRVRDEGKYLLKTGLEAIAKVHTGDFRLTANQNLIIGDVHPDKLSEIAAILQHYGIDNSKHSGMRLASMACVALPTCALAMAESERYLPRLIDKIDAILDRENIRKESIMIRMSGCPNGCSRPYMAEIAFVGKAPGAYNMYLGGGFAGNRVAKLYRESVNEKQILDELDPMLTDFAANRRPGEHFGDFVIRKEIVAPVLAGKLFHEEDNHKLRAYPTPSGTFDIYW